ncbi:hypothetical protein IMG5_016390 [Ichthyophthirius multifiliis]|uniref:DOMON domain-containing protein n=1 Tax=Ichthyophthirius multifiliis TaxID=5932 RepID=G0QKD5_ICHMU|nr:hypothetical protein IMG5_016390 [Ichthyophthirius multifiliis]EGR34323.1 hypothetical protein IMG5_016390 [Ichthyophthirius multifiliis]|eukprot:XP_004039627.1 hypothetical protein IMG5_016390 [Ichthyophthirius multifiliis]
MIIITTQNNQLSVLDAYSTGYQAPEADIQDVILDPSSILDANGDFQAKFSRLLDTKDPLDEVLKENGKYKLCFAWGQSKSLSKHSSSDRISFQNDIILANDAGNLNVVNNDDMIILELHKIILFYGWGILVDIGIIFARYFKTWKHYILVHTLCFFVLDVLTIIFEALILDQNKDKLSDGGKILQENAKSHYIIGVGALSKLLHEQYTQHQWSIEGPLGTGLNFQENEENKKYVFFCGGTGLFPFLDLIDILFKKNLQYALPQDSKLFDPFSCGYSQFFKGCTFQFYCAFQTFEDFVGHEWILQTYEISQKLQNRLFDIQIRVSAGQVPEGFKQTKEYFNKKFVEKNVKKNEVDKVFICGNPQMNNTLYNALNELGFSKLQIVLV